MTLWNDTFQGSDNVIQANLKNFSQYAFCAIVTFIFRKNKSKYLYLLIICTLVPLIYFAFFIKGSRGESLFLLITISFILSMKYPQKHKLISKSISIPEHSHRAPFTAFQNTQDDLLECLYTHKVKVLGYNEVLILNECFIRPPKEEI